MQLFGRGIARATADKEALIIDGGTQAGVMALIGQGVAGRARKVALLGVAPIGRVTYPGQATNGGSKSDAPLEPNHSHFVLVDSQEWGGETKTMYELAEALARNALGPALPADGSVAPEPAKEGAKIPVVTVLVGSSRDGIAKNEVVESVRHNWPVIVVEGSGPLPDEIARLWRKKRQIEVQGSDSHENVFGWMAGWWQRNKLVIDDPALAEIIDDGQIHFFSLDSPAAELRELISRLLTILPPKKKRIDPTLELAWQRFALYDLNAGRQQVQFKLLKNWPLVLAVVSTLLALSYTALTGSGWVPEISWLGLILRFFIIVVPIVTSILLAVDTRIKAGSKWILLRFSAEAIKREIYRYRILSEISNDQPELQPYNKAELAQRVENISRRLMRTDVNEAALLAYQGSIPPKMYGAAATDDGYSQLDPERYLAIRLNDQLNYYQGKTPRLEKQLRRFQWWILSYGGAGALLAAVGGEMWIPLTITIVTSLTTYLEYQQVEQTLKKYNQAKTNLENIQGWWAALSAAEKQEAGNIQKLVNHTEQILESELSGWVQEMQNALADLREGQDGGESGETRNNGKSGELSGRGGGEAPAQRPELEGPAPDRARTDASTTSNQPEVRAGDQQVEAGLSSEGD